MFPVNCIRGSLLFITASCSFTCVCLQTAVLHAASRLTWTCVWWLSSLTGVQCDTVISRHARAHAHTHGLPQYSKAVNTSIYRQPRESCKQSWCHARVCIVIWAGFHHQNIPSAFWPKGGRWLQNPTETRPGSSVLLNRSGHGDKIQQNNCSSDKEASTFITETKAKSTH